MSGTQKILSLNTGLDPLPFSSSAQLFLQRALEMKTPAINAGLKRAVDLSLEAHRERGQFLDFRELDFLLIQEMLVVCKELSSDTKRTLTTLLLPLSEEAC